MIIVFSDQKFTEVKILILDWNLKSYTAELKTEMESDLVQVVCGKDTFSIPANKLAANS